MNSKGKKSALNGKFHGPGNSWQGNQGKGMKTIARKFDSLAFIPLPSKCYLLLALYETCPLNFVFLKKAALRSAPHFCLLIFAFCLLISSARAQDRINLNTASVAELTRLPYVGQTVAQRITEHRRKHGSFKRPQDIIIIKGLSAKRYRQIAHLIRI